MKRSLARLVLARLFFVGPVFVRPLIWLVPLWIAFSLLGFDPRDPTLLDTSPPAAGINHPGGYPAALTGGTLILWWGGAAWLIPPLTWYFLRGSQRLARTGILLHGGILLLASAALIALFHPAPATLGAGVLPALGHRAPGIAGYALQSWLLPTLGITTTAIMLSFLAGCSLHYLGPLQLRRTRMLSLQTLLRIPKKKDPLPNDPQNL